MALNVGSLFSGVGGLDLGLERAGHRIVFQAESDPYRRRVLARHWPGVSCFEDVRSVHAAPDPSTGRNGRGGIRGASGGRCAARPDGEQGALDSVDLLCGGFPCQDLSVAGRRAGLDGARSGLFFEFARIADELVGTGGWVLIENVPGLLSSKGGRDFAVLLSTLADLGFLDLAYRIIDSRYLGVPQRRRRVFILARRARGRRAAEILLEPESGGGDFEAGRQTGARVAASLSRGSSGAGVSEPGRRQEDDENIVGPLMRYGRGDDHEAASGQFVNALDRRGGGADDNEAQAGQLIADTVRSHPRPGSNSDGNLTIAHTLRSEGFDASEDGTGRGTPLTIAGSLGGGNDGIGRRSEDDPNLVCAPADPDGMRAPSGISRHMDDPDWPNPRPDGPRYAACGDAVTVNVSHWIGLRFNAKAAA